MKNGISIVEVSSGKYEPLIDLSAFGVGHTEHFFSVEDHMYIKSKGQSRTVVAAYRTSGSNQSMIVLVGFWPNIFVIDEDSHLVARLPGNASQVFESGGAIWVVDDGVGRGLFPGGVTEFRYVPGASVVSLTYEGRQLALSFDNGDLEQATLSELKSYMFLGA